MYRIIGWISIYGLSIEIKILLFRSALLEICCREDARKKTNGLSPVSPEVIETVIRMDNFWDILAQLIRIVKPLADGIGNLESRNINLADCVLEMLRCARTLAGVKLEEGDSEDFLSHARNVFNRRFNAMNTARHSLALFLHPLCRKLAISSKNGRTFDFMLETAVGIAKQWRWGRQKADRLLTDLRLYHQCKEPFSGGQSDGLDWWENLAVRAEEHPLKILAVTLFSIVPHSAEVERLFSTLSGVQSPKRATLSVKNFEGLAIC